MTIAACSARWVVSTEETMACLSNLVQKSPYEEKRKAQIVATCPTASRMWMAAWKTIAKIRACEDAVNDIGTSQATRQRQGQGRARRGEGAATLGLQSGHGGCGGNSHQSTSWRACVWHYSSLPSSTWFFCCSSVNSTACFAWSASAASKRAPNPQLGCKISGSSGQSGMLARRGGKNATSCLLSPP